MKRSWSHKKDKQDWETLSQINQKKKGEDSS
jgi:hypothetical protein